jgi:lipid A 4'-phosphatase
MKSYYRKNIFNWVLFLVLISVLFFVFPKLDIYISNLFYKKGQGFVYSDNYFVKIIFKSIPLLTYTAAIIYCISGLYQYFINKKFRKIFLYLLLTLIIGPGIIVNSLLKGYFGRARPKNITEFGGDSHFTRVAQISNQCHLNCSFSSGHAAGAYHFTNISLVSPRRFFKRFFNSAMIFGTIVGLVRIMQGGHFASDVIFSCLVVLVVNVALRSFIFKNRFVH